jgi:hypothetical protein
VKILLLNVSGLSLESGVTLTTVNKHFTSDYTHSYAASKNIEESGLSRSRNTLHS